ncbi:hypothetical protein TthAA37_05930 [Thermus thermophilus]|uniref:DMT family transporter n=1 Tax=Thermus thermophilus TaxID=274 RepID=UPI001C75A480|nr:DMT family transporter [Thermus thermophilus]BCZ91404.1 hypothetical protein TthAA37_05930 [Thermus thermophilus]
MDAHLLPLGFGLLSALTWGAGDFGGGMASRRAHAQAVVLWVSGIGLLLFLFLAQVFGEAPQGRDLPYALLGGASGALGLLAFYRALAQGEMGLAAPVAGVVGAALPMALGALLEGWPGLFPALGMGLGLLAVWLVSRPEGRARPGNLGLALLAGLGFGGFYAFMDRVEGLFYPAAWAKLTAFLLVLPAALRARPWPGGREAPWVLLAGLGDAGGNLFFLLAAQAGRLDVAAVLSSFYPVFTVLLAWLVLKERLSRGRLTGVGLSLLAMALIALG